MLWSSTLVAHRIMNDVLRERKSSPSFHALQENPNEIRSYWSKVGCTAKHTPCSCMREGVPDGPTATDGWLNGWTDVHTLLRGASQRYDANRAQWLDEILCNTLHSDYGSCAIHAPYRKKRCIIPGNGTLQKRGGEWSNNAALFFTFILRFTRFIRKKLQDSGRTCRLPRMR